MMEEEEVARLAEKASGVGTGTTTLYDLVLEFPLSRSLLLIFSN